MNIFYKKKQKKFKDLNLIFSYSTKNDFDKNGNFKDKFFNFNSTDKNYYWILIALDNFVPKKVNENIAIIAYEKKIFKYSFIFFLREFFTIIKNQKFNFKRIIHFFWEEHSFSSEVSFLCKNLLQDLKIKNFIINYEGVPFQNQLLSDIKKINYKIKTHGYLHCAPWPLQLDLIYKNQFLDNLVVSGTQQKNVLKKFLGWKKKKISVIPTLRFEKTNKREFNGYLFVPYKLDKKKII